jgi:hypothetical protein
MQSPITPFYVAGKRDFSILFGLEKWRFYSLSVDKLRVYSLLANDVKVSAL